MMLPRWKDVVPAMSTGMVIRRAEPTMVSAAISAVKTILRVEIADFFSIEIPPWFLYIIRLIGYKNSAKMVLKNKAR